MATILLEIHLKLVIYQMSWHLYLLECADQTLYTGISNRLEERIDCHNRGEGAKYTRGRLPVKLIFSREFENRSEASKAEAFVKKLPKREKMNYFK